MWKVKGYEESNHIQCSLCESPKILIEPIVQDKVSILMGEYPHQEWLAHLVGRREKDTIIVEDISIPPHEGVGGAWAEGKAVEFDPDKGYQFYEPENCVGFIHSHHSMGAFHSGTDHEHVDKNYPVSITVAKSGTGLINYNTVCYTVTPCKRATVKPTEVKFLSPKPLFNHKAFLKEARKNIDSGAVSPTPSELDIIPTETVTKVPVRDTYIPIKYRSFNDIGKDNGNGGKQSTFITDGSGRVLGKREVEEILRER